jgi:hypothetical protein
MSLVVFTQMFGGTLFLAFAQTIFSRGLSTGLAKYAPTVNVRTVVEAGATGIKNVVKPEEVTGVLKAYNLAINHDFYLAAGSAVAFFACSWGMGWHSIKKKKEVAEQEV